MNKTESFISLFLFAFSRNFVAQRYSNGSVWTSIPVWTSMEWVWQKPNVFARGLNCTISTEIYMEKVVDEARGNIGLLLRHGDIFKTI